MTGTPQRAPRASAVLIPTQRAGSNPGPDVTAIASIAGIFNVSFTNMQMIELAELITKKIEVPIVRRKEITDSRSYYTDCSKIRLLGFYEKHNIEEAIEEIKENYHKIQDYTHKKYHNDKWMREKK